MSHSNDGSSRRPKYVDPASFTPHFAWKKGGARGSFAEEVFCEKVALRSIAEKVGTPTYVYSRAAIEDAYHELDRGLGAVPHTLCFAVKSNGKLSILNHLARLGSGFDIVSGGELHHLRRIGVRGDRIVFSGVGKERHEIREALNYRAGQRGGRPGILLFNAESEAELEVLVEEAARLVEKGGTAPAVAIRVNPDVQAGGHPHIATGRHEHKFGLDWSEAKRLYVAHRDSRWICWRGISAHIGSQITSLEPFRRALRRLVGFADGAQAWRAPLAGAWAFDHRSGRRSAYASGVYENKSRKDLCGGGLGDERPDAPDSLRGDPSNHEGQAGKKRKGRHAPAGRHRWPSLRNGRLLFAGLAARGSEDGRPARDLGHGCVWNEPSFKLQRATPASGSFRGREPLPANSPA